MPKYKLPIKERFKDKYSVTDSGCWEWKGALREDGYGTLKIKGRCEGAHLFSYMIFKGEIPDGLCVLHTCDNRKCICPDHLFLGTKKVNLEDAIAKGRRYKSVCPSYQSYKKGCRCDDCKLMMKSLWRRWAKNANNKKQLVND